MKQKQTNILPLLMGALGLLTWGLRTALYAAALDEKNLLRSGHVLSYMVWAVTAAAVAVAAAGALRQRGSEKYADHFGPNVPGAAGAAVLGIALGITVFAMGTPFTLLEKLRFAAGVACVPGMLYVAVCRLRGKQPLFLCHSLLCVFLALYLVSHYRLWSGNPQLQDYVFGMLALVVLALFSYQQAAFDVDSGKPKLQLLTGLLSGFLCTAALCRTEYPWLYVAGAVWSLTNLCSPGNTARANEGV